MLQSMGLQRVRHDWATEQQQLQQEGVKRNQGSLTHSLRSRAWGGLGWELVGGCELLPYLRLRQEIDGLQAMHLQIALVHIS